MDDDFEYLLLDYGVGTITTYDVQGRPSGPFSKGLWLKFSVTNKAEHLLAVPRYRNPGAITARNNWGNEYYTGSVSGISPFPTGRDDRYKPGDQSLELRTITNEELVKDMRELRVYLDRWRNNGPSLHFFVLKDPMHRARDLVRDLDDPDPSELHVSIGTEPRPPTALERLRRRK